MKRFILILSIWLFLLVPFLSFADEKQTKWQQYGNLGDIYLFESPLMSYFDSHIDQCTLLAQVLISLPMETSISIHYSEETNNLSYYEVYAYSVEYIPLRPSTINETILTFLLRTHFTRAQEVAANNSIMIFSNDSYAESCVCFVMESVDGWRVDAFYFDSPDKAASFSNGNNCFGNWVFRLYRSH